ncbi:MAG TPA: type VII secretion target [Candidatus Limnocylindrales bacterium]|nr:type VII secretion target [Candidatus Limnocylindrales bacterium]
MANEVRVDPELLRAGGRACRAVGDGIGRSVSDVEPETVGAQKALPGWATAKALNDVLWWWRDDLEKLEKRLDATADALEACAQDYRTTDQANADHFYRAQRPW